MSVVRTFYDGSSTMAEQFQSGQPEHSYQVQYIHWPENNLNRRIKTVSVTAGVDVLFTYLCTVFLAHKPDINRCISSNRDRPDFYEDIHIIFMRIFILFL